MISERDRQILEQLPGWNPAEDIAAQRRAWEELAVAYNQDLPAIGGLEENVELRPGLCTDVAVPMGAGRHPVAIYLHGGGWAFGSPTSFRKLGMQFAEAGYLTFVLDYRLAPEHPFPAALEDAIFAIRWATDNARRWNGDGQRIAIGGDSAGANLAVSALISSAHRAALAGAGRSSLLRCIRSQGDGGAHPLDSRTSTAIEHVRFRHRRVTRRSTRKPPQSGGAGHTSTVFHYRSRRRLLVSCRLVDAWPGLVGRGEPLRAARDGRNAARLHADERA